MEAQCTMRKGMARKFLWICGAIIVLVALLFLLAHTEVGEYFLCRIDLYLLQYRINSSQLQKQVGKCLALHCQSDKTLFPELLNSGWYPPELDGLDRPFGEPQVWIGTNTAYVSWGGGLVSHFGYNLYLDPDLSDQLTNVWRLGEKNETMITLDRSQELTADDILRRLDRRLDSPRETEAYIGKVQLLLTLGKLCDAKRCCEQWANKRPDCWQAQSMLAHVCSRLGEGHVAQEHFADWVARHKSFENYILLSIFYTREGCKKLALEAIRTSLHVPSCDVRSWRGSYLALAAMEVSFIGGDYDLTIAMCDKLESALEKGDEWYMSRLRAASLFMKSNVTEAVACMRKTQDYGCDQVEWNRTFDRDLLIAIRNGDTAFVQFYWNWNTNASLPDLFHQGDNMLREGSRIVTPYPKDWDESRFGTDR